MKRKIRQFLLGKEWIEDYKLFKQVLLQTQFALVVIIVSIFFAVLDVYFNVFTNLIAYVFLMVAGILVIIVARIKKYNVSSFVLVITVNLTILVFVAASPAAAATYMFVGTGSVLCLVILFPWNKPAALLTTVIPPLAAIVLYETRFTILPFVDYSKTALRVNFFSNLFIATLVTCYLVYVILNRNGRYIDRQKSTNDELNNTNIELKRTEARLKNVLTGIGAGVYEWNIISNKVYVSTAWRNLTGYSESDLLNFSLGKFLTLIHADDLVSAQDSFRKFMAMRSTFRNTYRIKCKSGEFRWFCDTGIFVASTSLSDDMVVGSIVDIHDQKIAEEELYLKNQALAKANNELDSFVYSASHDMRAPISSIQGLLNLGNHASNFEELKGYHRLMNDRLSALERFIRDITDYSRNANLDLLIESINVSQLIRETVSMANYLPQFDRINVTVTEPGPILALTDFLRLKVVLTNIINNAILHHDLRKDDPFVEISCVATDNLVQINVRDNGKGIDEARLHRIFDMFYRGNEESKGSGLGLYIAKEAVAKLNGKISVTSKVGIGSEFRVEIPALVN